MARLTSPERTLDELNTPVPIADIGRVEHNLDRMADYAARHRLALRPHTKTHKSPVIARMQMDRGAVGLTCATPRELEVMSAVCGDVLLGYPPVSPHVARRVAAISRSVRVTVALDSAEAMHEISAAAVRAGREVDVYVEVDIGMNRVGVQSAKQASLLAKMVGNSPALNFAGIAFYPGHIRRNVEEQESQLSEVSDRLGEVIAEMDAAGVRPGAVSGGSTPTAWRSHEIAGVTEVRPGTYVYNDRTTAMLGACEWDDCALTILATVVSTSVGGQAVVDAGTKALGREPVGGTVPGEGFGSLLEHPEVIVKAMSEEHGLLDLTLTAWAPRVGDLVRIIPNHVCIAVHLFDEVIAVRDGRIVDTIPVVARGRRE